LQTIDHKKQIRRQFRKTRQSITSSKRSSYSQQICEQINQQSFYHEARSIGVYLALEEEVQLENLIRHARHLKKSLLLPVIEAPFSNGIMNFHSWNENDTLDTDSNGIQQLSRETLVSRNHDLISIPEILIMPLVAFSNKGERLGMGGGFYDRYLYKCKAQKTSPLKVGVAFSCQYSESLPTEEHDQKLDYMITENRLISFI